MLTGCASHWPASSSTDRQWSFAAFARHNETRFPLKATLSTTFDPQQQKWQKSTWQQVLQAMHDGQFFYIFDQLRHADVRDSITADFTVPLVFQNVDMYKALTDFPPRYGPRRWYVDPSGTDAWNTAIEGTKWWIVYPTSVTDATSVASCNPTCGTENEITTTKDWYANVVGQS